MDILGWDLCCIHHSAQKILNIVECTNVDTPKHNKKGTSKQTIKFTEPNWAQSNLLLRKETSWFCPFNLDSLLSVPRALSLSLISVLWYTWKATGKMGCGYYLLCAPTRNHSSSPLYTVNSRKKSSKDDHDSLSSFDSSPHTARETPFMYYFPGNSAASAPISTFMCLRAIL